MDNESYQHSNIAEEEIAQLHSLHLSFNAIAKVRAAIGTGVSLVNCAICGESIPEARRIVVQGCRHCIICQTKIESKG